MLPRLKKFSLQLQKILMIQYLECQFHYPFSSCTDLFIHMENKIRQMNCHIFMLYFWNSLLRHNCYHTLTSSFSISPLAKKPFKAVFNSERLASSKGYKMQAKSKTQRGGGGTMGRQMFNFSGETHNRYCLETARITWLTMYPD